MQDSILSLLPPIVAIAIAIWRKNALLALLGGLYMCFFLNLDFSVSSAGIETASSIFDVFSSIGNLYIVSFSLLIGAMVALINQSGAVNGFIQRLTERKLFDSPKRAGLLPTLIGTSIFTDTNLSMFTAGMASQPLFAHHKLSKARLAYFIDSTCAPISILLLLNGWGAYVLGLLDGYSFTDPVGILISTVGYNFYAILAVILAYYTAWSGKVYGPLALADEQAKPQANGVPDNIAPSRVMWLPLLLLFSLTLVLLWYTGDGDLRRGSGSFSVFWSIVTSLILLISLVLHYGLLNFSQVLSFSYQGIKKMLPVVAVLVLSFAFGDAIKALGTGVYISQLIDADVPLFVVAPIIFIAAGLMAFSTGTSWGTFALLVPIAVPISMQTGLPAPLLIGAVLGGGIFGDHASPISDTTIVASIASGCDHFEHVKTQLPYALFVGVISIMLYAVAGWLV